MADSFKIGDLVWAKMKGWNPWPGKVSEPPANLKLPKAAKGSHCIFFFGSNNFAWIETGSIKTYDENKGVCANAAKTAAFKEACAAIEEYKEKLLAGEIVVDQLPVLSVDADAKPEEVDEPVVVDDKKEVAKKVVRKRKPSKKAAAAIEENGETAKAAAKKDKDTPTPKKRKYNGRITPVLGLTPTPAPTTPAAGPSPSSSNHVVRKSAAANLLDRPININKTTDTPLNITHVSQTLKDKKITPSALKFGFLGLGTMGSGIVKNLLNSGHKMTVWNRTTAKCNNFVTAGAEHGITPGDVIQTSDITFSCVSHPVAAKEMVFGNCGVLQEITVAKGYVEMTSIDAETSQDLAESIRGKGGRYLEAQIQGSKTEAGLGTLVIIAAGDRDLYEDCQSAFQAMGKHSFYLGEVGNASKMNLVMQVLQGVAVATLAESMALADRAGLQQRDVLEILGLTNMSCPLYLEKGNGIIEATYPTHQPLQHIQKDLNLALGMGNTLEQPLPLAASANEIYKHAKRLGYGEHDMAAKPLRRYYNRFESKKNVVMNTRDPRASQGIITPGPSPLTLPRTPSTISPPRVSRSTSAKPMDKSVFGYGLVECVDLIDSPPHSPRTRFSIDSPGGSLSLPSI